MFFNKNGKPKDTGLSLQMDRYEVLYKLLLGQKSYPDIADENYIIMNNLSLEELQRKLDNVTRQIKAYEYHKAQREYTWISFYALDALIELVEQNLKK